MGTIGLIVMVIVSLIFAAGSAKADTIFTNFGFDNAYNHASGDPVTGSGFKNGRQGIVFAAQFTPTADFTFTDAKLALILTSGANSADVYLESDCGGLPCAVIEEIILNNALTTGTGSIVTANSLQKTVLYSGTPYWLVLAAGGSDTLA